MQKAVPAALKKQTPSPSVKCNVPPIPQGTSSWQPPLPFAAATLSSVSTVFAPFSVSPVFPTHFLQTRRRLNRLLEAIDGADASQRYVCVYLRVFPEI